MQNVCDKFLCATRKKLNTAQYTIESVIANANNDQIEKILSAKACVHVKNDFYEPLSGEFMLNGCLVVDLIYLTQNGEINCNKSSSNFAYKISDEFVCGTCKLYAKAYVVDVVILSVNQESVKVATTISVETFAIKNDSVEYLVESEENACVKKEQINGEYLLCDVCSKFTETNQATIKGGVKKVLGVESFVSIKNTTPGYGFVSVSGEILNRIVYIDNSDGFGIKTLNVSNEFKQEIEANNVNQQSKIEAYAQICHENVETTLENSENDCIINIANPIEVCFKVFESKSYTVVSDIYSTKYVLNTTTQSYKNAVLLDSVCYEDKIEGSLTLTDNNPRVDKFLSVGGCDLVVSSSYISDGAIVVEGVAKANIIYLNDELNSTFSVETEVPFVAQSRTDFAGDVEAVVNASLCDVDVMVKKGREVYFDAKIKVHANLYQNNVGAVLSSVENVADNPDKDCSIEIYFAKQGESFWDIAKELKISTELIQMQNPDIKDPLEQDTNISLYYQKNK